MTIIDFDAFQAVQESFGYAATSQVTLVVIVENAPPRGRRIQSQRANHDSRSRSYHRNMAEEMDFGCAFELI